MSLREGYQIASQILKYRKQIQPYNNRRWEIYGLTADAAGEEAYHRYLCVATAIWVDTQERIFQNVSEFEKQSPTRDQVLTHYMTIMRIINDFANPLPAELGFFRDYGFMEAGGKIYDFDKQNVVLDYYGEDEEEEQRKVFDGGFTDDSGNVVEATGVIKRG